MAGHTKGPWKHLGGGDIRGPDGKTIALTYGPVKNPVPSAEANARLIAAAPELLEACQWFMAQLDASVLVRDISNDGDPDFHTRMLKFVAALGKASAAIAKAEGSAE